MAKTPCGFCGEKRKITNEHVFGEWVGRLLGAGQDDMIVRHALGREGQSTKSWYSYSLDHKVRIACKTCNEGWMHKLEETVEPVISPMILGGRRALSLRDQVVIASWAVKTSMVQEFSHDKRRHFTQDERRALLEDAVPTHLGARVWAGRYAARNRGVHGLSSSLLSLVDHTPGAHLSTFAIGQFTLQVLAERFTAEQPTRPPIRPGAWDRLLILVWPPSRYADIEASGPVWPPPLSLTEQGYDELFDRFMAFGVKRPPFGPNNIA